jgi:hypothetical protein
VQILSRPPNASTLLLAAEALAQGETSGCRELARQVYRDEVPLAGRHLRAQALLLWAKADVLESRFARALRTAGQAAKGFSSVGDATGQAAALALHSYAAASLGREETALGVANECRGVAEALGDNAVRATSLNYLGVASFWAADTGQADEALAMAAWFAQEGDVAGRGFQPLLNLCFSELLTVSSRSLANRDDLGSTGDPERLKNLLRECRRLAFSERPRDEDNCTARVAGALLSHVAALTLIHCGDERAACAHLYSCEAQLLALPAHSWLQALPSWARAEQARLAGNPSVALQHAGRMRQLSALGEHVPMQAIAYRIADALDGQALARR